MGGRKPLREHVNKYAHLAEKSERSPLPLEHGAGQMIGANERKLLERKQAHLSAFRGAFRINQPTDRSGRHVDIIDMARRERRQLVDLKDFDTGLVTNFIHFLQVEAPQIYKEIVDGVRKRYPDLNKPANRDAYKKEVLAQIRQLMETRGVYRNIRE